MSDTLFARVGRTAGEIGVIGLGKSGYAVAVLLRRDGYAVYASDGGTSDTVCANAVLLRDRGVHVDVGSHDLQRIAAAALVVASPGVPPTAPALLAAEAAGVPIVGEMEVALNAMPGLQYIAITGTNGKTTTTALAGHLLRALGHHAVDAGNIGTALAEVALRADAPGWVALECSSFQLHDTPGINPTVGVVTNLSPDHLDRYVSIDDYYEDKARIFTHDGPHACWVLNGDDAEVLQLHHRLGRAGTLGGEVFTFRIGHPADAWYDPASDQLQLLGKELMHRSELGLVGDHNVANALTAALAVSVASPSHRTDDARRLMAAALRTFRALPHRLEPVPTSDGRLWLNDSKATNVSSTLVAVQGMTRPFVLLLGGKHKGEPYSGLAAPFKAHGKAVIAYGEAAERIVSDLQSQVPVERVDGSFAEVVARARVLTAPGDAVLLSPACSSYDMFRNYEERGAAFRALAAGVPA